MNPAHPAPAVQAEHTKGPWMVQHSPKYGVPFVTNHTGKMTISGSVGGATLAEQEANAALLAAAPDLLSALQMAQATIERLTVRNGPFSSTDGTQDVIRKAIARATLTA